MLRTLIFLAVAIGASGTLQPMLSVISGSMEPDLYRGSMIAIQNWTTPRVDDVVVFDIDGRDQPIVHRVTHLVTNDCFRTKGDNNFVDDLFLYKRGQKCVDRAHIRGIVWLNVPFLGWPAIMVSGVLGKIALAAFVVFTSRSDIHTIYRMIKQGRFRGAFVHFMSL